MDQIQPCCNAVVLRVINDTDDELMGENLSLFAAPKDLTLPQGASITVNSIIKKDDGTLEVTLHSDKIILYVVISCQIEGQFEDNAFLMQPAKNKVLLTDIN